MFDELLYVIPANTAREDVKKTLEAHPEIKFVSLVGIDMAGNDTAQQFRSFVPELRRKLRNSKLHLEDIAIGAAND